MSLHRTIKAPLRSLKTSDVVNTFATLQPAFAANLWLMPQNLYATDTVRKIRRELGAGGLSSQADLAQYIAVSSFLHCIDGWSYLGRALTSVMRGDPHRAVHFGYYAELRAAMALLAANGIGVFDHQHFYISAPNAVVALPRNQHTGTHRFTWDCLEFWSGEQNSSSLFLKSVTPYGRPLTEWLVPIAGAAVTTAKAQRWFIEWGMDLKLSAKDRDARNDSSYRPDGVPTSWTLGAGAALNVVKEVWEVLEPIPGALFGKLDQHILRIALESVYKGTTDQTPSQADPQYISFIKAVLQHQGLTGSVENEWMRFLTRQQYPANHPLFEYSSKPPTDPAVGHAAVLSRAAFLLRFASSAASHLAAEAAVAEADLGFWQGAIATNRGLCHVGDTPDPLTDLWLEISPHMEDLATFQVNTPDAQKTFHKVGRELSAAIVGLSGCEAVALWSMSPSAAGRS